MFLIESLARIDEQAKITGVALIPRISRNNRLYTKEELKRFDNVTVPLNWEHDSNKIIGKITFHYNPELETVYYDGLVSDEKYAQLVKNKTLFTSIEAEPQFSQQVCNGPSDCFEMPFGLLPHGLALTESPGVPETSVKVVESLIKENCMSDCLQAKKDAGKPIDDQAKAICSSECEDENIKKLKSRITELESLVRELTTCKKCGGIRKNSSHISSLY